MLSEASSGSLDTTAHSGPGGSEGSGTSTSEPPRPSGDSASGAPAMRARGPSTAKYARSRSMGDSTRSFFPTSLACSAPTATGSVAYHSPWLPSGAVAAIRSATWNSRGAIDTLTRPLSPVSSGPDAAWTRSPSGRSSSFAPFTGPCGPRTSIHSGSLNGTANTPRPGAARTSRSPV